MARMGGAVVAPGLDSVDPVQWTGSTVSTGQGPLDNKPGQDWTRRTSLNIVSNVREAIPLLNLQVDRGT